MNLPSASSPIAMHLDNFLPSSPFDLSFTPPAQHKFQNRYAIPNCVHVPKKGKFIALW